MDKKDLAFLAKIPGLTKDTPTGCGKCGWQGLLKETEVLERINTKPSAFGCPRCHAIIFSIGGK